MSATPSPITAAAQQTVKTLQAEKDAILRRRDRDNGRLEVIDLQLAALTAAANPPASPAPAPAA